MKRSSPRTNGASRKMATIKDVAARAGVSTATVSRVLAGLKGAGDDVRTRVLRAAKALDFQPNRLARGLRARKRMLIGLVIPDLQNPFFTGVVHGVESLLSQAGYTLLLGHSDGLANREQIHLNLLRGEGAAGLILIPGNAAGANYESLRTGDIPVVAVDRAPKGLSCDLVRTANRDGARTAVRHLLSLGHQGVALVNGPKHFDVARERLAGYREALTEAGLDVRSAWITHGDFRQSSGYTLMQRLLKGTNPPRSVLVGNNLMTLGALQCIHEYGLRIPDQIAVVGFDDMPWATSLWPPLTAVAQPTEELGRTAAQLLLDRLANPDRMVRQVVLPTQLVVRASCGALGQSVPTSLTPSRAD